MLVFYKERLVFLSVPKTGTTAYHDAFRDRADIVISHPTELKHAPLYRYNRYFRPMFEKVCKARMEILAVMREPVSWLNSWYRYRQRPFLEGKPNSTLGISFDEFVSAYLQENRPAFADVGSQAKFLEPRPNGTSVTHLFRYEEPESLAGFLRDRLGDVPEIERRNVSPGQPAALSESTERSLRQKHAADFQLYESIS